MTISQDINEIQDCNQESGVRLVQGGRTFVLDGAIWVDAADSDFEMQNLIASVAPTADLAFTVGTPSTAQNDVNNAYKVECNNIETRDIKYNREGTSLVVEFSGARCTATVAGGEFTFVYA